MVFPQVPVYLDPPNWHQLNHHQQGTGSENPQLPPLPTPTDHHHHHQQQHVGPGSIRSGSTADRDRLANKVPQPEAVQKCPRCDSTNTKFCYFNNYSLTQPRHFCKTCRRYWTRGGALRSVPVGGGCRRNKKKKSSSTSSSKSTVSAERQSGSNSTNNGFNIPSEITAHLPQTPHIPNFMASLKSFSQYGMGNIGLNFGGIQVQNGQGDHMGFQIGTNPDILSVRSGNHHQQQQFPFFEPNNGLYNPLQSEYMEASAASMVGSETQFLRSTSPSPRVSQRGPVKMENNNQDQGLNLTRPLLGVSDNQNNNQYWGGNNWTDLSCLK